MFFATVLSGLFKAIKIDLKYVQNAQYIRNYVLCNYLTGDFTNRKCQFKMCKRKCETACILVSSLTMILGRSFNPTVSLVFSFVKMKA